MFTCHQNVAVWGPPEMLRRATTLVRPADRRRWRFQPSRVRRDILQQENWPPTERHLNPSSSAVRCYLAVAGERERR